MQANFLISPNFSFKNSKKEWEEERKKEKYYSEWKINIIIWLKY